MFLSDSDSKPHSRLMRVPNLLKNVEKQSGRAREKPKDEHNETKLSQFTSRFEQSLSLDIFNKDIFNKMAR